MRSRALVATVNAQRLHCNLQLLRRRVLAGGRRPFPRRDANFTVAGLLAGVAGERIYRELRHSSGMELPRNSSERVSIFDARECVAPRSCSFRADVAQVRDSHG